MRDLVRIGCIVVALALFAPTEARADQLWKPEYRETTALETSVLVSIGVVFFVGEYTLPEPQTPRIRHGILFDDAARDLLRAPGAVGRHRADVLSDYGFWGLTAAPFIDAALTAWVAHGDGKAAVELTRIYAEAFGLGEALTLLTKLATARQRPYAYDAGCPTDGCIANTSFPSGHTSRAFTGATLICTTHAYLGMFGTTADVLACAAALGIATATGAMRLVADKHWSTDVIAGALVGAFSGWAVPFFHFHTASTPSSTPPRQEKAALRLWPIAAPAGDGLSLGLAGTFF